jgi:hypothetical protein
VASIILDSAAYVVRWFAMGLDGSVLYTDCSIMSGIGCEPCGGLCVTLDCLV